MMWSVGRWPLALASLLCLTGAALAQQAAPTEAPMVETTAVKLAPVVQQGEFVGTVVAAQQVALTARVEGLIDKLGFIEGSFVPAGTIAFVIEKDTYQAALDGANATLQSAIANEAGAEANLKQSELTLKRQVELLRSNAVPQSAVDQAQATRDINAAQLGQAKAQIAQARAQVQTAELNLSFTDVRTQIAGRIGKAQYTVGNLVSPSSGTLATVVQTDPIRVAFSISDREYLEVVRALKPDNNAIETDETKYQPRLRLSDGTDYPLPGKISFLNNTVDSSTGTIAVYAEFANPTLMLVPGQFVSVTVLAGKPQEYPVVPAAAVLQDQDGPYVFMLGEDNHALLRRVTLGPRVGTDWAVESGLVTGELVISTGIQKIRAGVVVTPTAAPTGN